MAKVVKAVVIAAVAVAIIVFAPQIAAVLASVVGSLGVTVAAASITSALIGMGISLALTAVATMFTKAPSMSQSLADRLNTSVVPTASRKIVFGTTAGGQDVRFFEGDLDFPKSKIDGYAQVIALASHRINAVKEFYVEEDLVWSNGSLVAKHGGFAPASPFRYVLEGKPGNGFPVGTGRYWNATASFTGCAYYVPFWKLDPDVWESGVPQRLTTIVDGCPLYDPRRDSTRGGSGSHRINNQDTWAFRDGSVEIGRNPALALLTYLIGWRINGKLVWGMGIPAHRIDFDNFRTYANVCEEQVATQAGTTVQRYTVDGIFSTMDSHETIINGLSAAMGSCKMTDRGGVYCLVGGYDDTAGPKIEFTADDLVAPANGASPYFWNPAPPSRERFNIVRGRFANPEELYQLTDWGDPIEREPLADGIPRTLSLDLGAVSRAETCQRIAKQFLLREYLTPGMFSATFGPKAFAVEVGSVITLSLPAEGWNNKLFRVIEQAESHDMFFQMTLREEDPAIYAWDREEKPLPASIRPQGHDASKTISPANLTLTSDSYSGANGINVSEVHVAWTPELSGRVQGIQIRSRPQGTEAWSEQAALFDPKVGTFTFTSNAPGITVEVQARFRMTSAVYSPWVNASVATAAVAISYDDVKETPTALGDINSGEGSKLGGIQAGATVGAKVGTNLIGSNNQTIASDEVMNASAGYSATATYDFSDNTTQGFTASGATLSVANGILKMETTSLDPILSVPVNLAGRAASIIRVRMRPTSATMTWQGQVYYGNQNHSDSEQYTLRLPTNPNTRNVWTVVEWDMSNLALGGTDYVDGTLNRLRFDLSSGPNETWEIDWVQLGVRMNATYGAPAGSTVGTIAVSDLVSKVNALDAAGLTDTVAPSVPTGLALTSTLTDAGVTFRASWNAVSASDLAGYVIALKEGSGNYVEFNAASNSFERTALPRNTAFTGKVLAYDKAGNRSAFSSEVTITTARDTTPPGSFTINKVDPTFETAFVTITAPTDLDIDRVRLDLYQGATLVGQQTQKVAPGQKTIVTFPKLSKATTYQVGGVAFDTSGNASPGVTSVQFTTAGGIAAGDFTPGLQPIQTVSALPAASGYTGPSLVLLSTDGKLYRYASGAWTKEVPYTDVTGKPTSLSEINSTQGSKLDGVEAGATKGAPSGTMVGSTFAQTLDARVTNGLTFADTRDVNSPPSYYLNQFATARTFNEFKTLSAIGLASGGNYGPMITTVPWQDLSGGPVQQEVRDSFGRYWNRYSTSTSAWSAWADTGAQINVGDSTITGTKITDDTIEAAKIKSNQIDTRHLKASSISADKLLIGDTTNFAENFDFQAGNVGWVVQINGGSGGIRSDSGNALRGTFVGAIDASSDVGFRNAGNMRVMPGDQLYGYAWTKAAGTGSSYAGLRICFMNANKAEVRVVTAGRNSLGTAFAKHEVFGTVQAGEAFARVELFGITGAATTMWLGAAGLMRRATGELIVDGSILSKHITTNTLEGDRIKADTLDAAKIKAKSIGAAQIKAGEITANEMKTGTLTAAQMAAGAITAGVLAVGNSDSIVGDAFFTDANWWTGGTADARFGVGDTGMAESRRELLITNNGGIDVSSMWFPADPGATYRINVGVYPYADFSGSFRPVIHVPGNRWMSLKGAGASIDPGDTNPDHNFTVAAGYDRRSFTFTNPQNADVGRWQFRFLGTWNGRVAFTVTIVRVGDATLIKDGAVETKHITVGTLDGDRIKAATLDAAKIKAGSIEADRLALGVKERVYTNLVNAPFWGSGDMSATPNWSPNNAGANSWYIGRSPTGGAEPLLRMLANGTEANGGWNTNINESEGWSRNKAYRYYTWFFNESGNNSYYHGCDNVQLLGGSDIGNPYFFAGGKAGLPYDKWYLFVGIVHPAGSTMSDSGVSGVYDPVTGQRIIPGSDFRWRPTATHGVFRSYQFYGAAGGVGYYTKPVVEEIVAGQTLAVRSLFQNLDYAQNINGGTTLITPGRILISNTTSLDDWRTGTEINGTAIKTKTVAADKISTTSLSAISANVGTVTAGLLRSTSGEAYFDLDNARIVFNRGGVMKVQGSGFGSANQFIEWFGPTQSNFANCTEANATYYLKTNGSAYFGGSLSAGIIKNAAQTTSTGAAAQVSTGTFGSNGRTRKVVLSYVFNYFASSSQLRTGGPGGVSATISLRRNGTEIYQLPVSGTWQAYLNSEGNGSYRYAYEEGMGGSITVTDNSGGSNVEYSAVIIARTRGPGPAGNIEPFTETMSQNISIASTEE